ncbi:MAG: hypothetical protein WBV06_11090, partial [Acidimicrobiia bacterium]
MRARLNLVVGAVTTMVVIAFLFPLTLTVRALAYDKAVTLAQNQEEAIAQFIALRAPNSNTADVIQAALLNRSDYATSVILIADSGGEEVFGEPIPEGENLDAVRNGAAYRAAVRGGQAVYTSVLLPTAGQTVVVRV